MGAAQSPDAAQTGPDEPRIKQWIQQRAHRTPLWAWPGLVVLVTGVLGQGDGHPRAAAMWIAFVSAWVTGVIVTIALEPASFAKHAARAAAAVVGMVMLALLLWQAGQPLL